VKKFNKGMLIIAVSSIALIGCKEGDDLSINNVTLKSPTYVIANGDATAMASVINMANDSTDVSVEEVDFRALPSEASAINLRSIASRLTNSDSVYCETGTGTVTASTNDVNESTGALSTNGSMKMTLTYNDCFESNYEYDYEYSTYDYYDLLRDGSTTVELKWRGYNSSSADFDSITYTMSFSDVTTTASYADDSIKTAMVDGVIKMKMTESEIAMAWALSVSGPETNGQIITTRTTENLSYNDSDQVGAGAWEVNGANGTKAEATIVANGVEVSINGGQAVLVTETYY
jgi:hypothetical protein